MTVRRTQRIHSSFSLIFIVLVTVTVTPRAFARSPAFVDGLPTVRTVLSRIHGNDALDTAARRVGIFDQLLTKLHPNTETLDTKRLFRSYRSAEDRIIKTVEFKLAKQKTSATGMNTPWAKWVAARWRYQDDASLLHEVLYPAPASKALAPRAPGAPLASAARPLKGGSHAEWWWLLLVPLFGGAGYPIWLRVRGKPLPPALQTPTLTASAPAAPSAPGPANLTGAVAPSDETVLPVDGGSRRVLLAQVEKNYRATMTSAVDQLTAVQMELQANEPVIAALRAELRRIGAKVHAETVKAIARELRQLVKVLLDAAKLRPYWRTLRTKSWRLKIVMLVITFWLFFLAVRAIGRHDYASVIGVYLASVALLFWLQWRALGRRAIAAIERSAASLKNPRLLYAYAHQVPGGQVGAMTYAVARISSASDQPPTDETSLPNQPDERGIGACFLCFDNAALYRLESNGVGTLVASQPGHALMSGHASVLTQTLAAHMGSLQPLIEPTRHYGELKWRERQQLSVIPRIEKLLASAANLGAIWEPVALSNAVFQFLIRRIDLFNLRDKTTPPGLLLYGYPGNGKEFIARKIAESTYAQFVKPAADRLASARGIRELWAAQAGATATVLFIDYADQIFARAGDEEGAGREATLAWLEEWSRYEPSRSGIWVVLSAQSEQGLHPRILAHLGGSKIEIPPPDAAGRERILAGSCEENQLPGSAPDWLVRDCAGASVRELREIVREARLQSLLGAPTEAQWREAVRLVQGADASYRDESKTWERLVLPAQTKEQLQRAVRILRDAEGYRDKKVSVPNILLYGPPGTGKTDIARTFANEGGVRFIAAGTADLKAQYIGQSAHLVRELFTKARAAAPCVLFIDEIETVAAKRGSPNADAFTQDIVTEMLAQMDGARVNDRPVTVLAATNLPEQIDPAILNRFTSRIEIALPDEPARRELLERLFRERPCAADLDIEEAATYLAPRLNRKSGRDLVMIVNRAMERAVAQSSSPDDVRLTRELLLAEALPQGKEVGDAELARIWEQIVLKPAVKEELLGKIRMFNRADKAAPKGLLLYGPPGTGKTEIARRIAESASCFFMALKVPDLKAGYVGQSGERVQRIWEQARARGRCVIFIDECEGVFARRGGTHSDAASEELVQAFLAEWDGVGTEDQRVWVVGATNRKDLLDDAIVSRFGASIEVDLPGAPERLAILRLELKKLERPGLVPAFVGELTTGMSGRDLSRVASDVCALAASQGGAVTDEMWHTVLQRHTESKSEAVSEDARWNSLVLADNLVEQLKTLCGSLRQAEAFNALGFEVPQGALLYGPPGTGKTQIARTLANESGLAFLAASTADLKAGYIGQSGQKVRELFETARGRAPCILFIDEMEAVAPVRGGPRADTFTGEIVNQLLQEMDGVKKSERHVFVLAATNLPDSIDPAVLSRFEDRIEIGNPDAEQRRRLFALFLAKLPVGFDIEPVARELASCSDGLGGRDIRSIVRMASQKAIRRAAGDPKEARLSREDLLESMSQEARA